jgi:hypothetical protein
MAKLLKEYTRDWTLGFPLHVIFLCCELKMPICRLMTVNNWENVEVTRYWEEMDTKGLRQASDLPAV